MYRIVIILLAWLLPIPGMASTLEYDIGDYTIELRAQDNGDIVVQERIEYRVLSGTLSQGHRQIPLRHLSGISNVAVEAANASLDSVEVERGRNAVDVRWSLPERRDDLVIELSYRARGALQADGDHNRVHWAVLGGGWSVPVAVLSARLHLPSDWLDSRDALKLRPSTTRISESDGWLLEWDFGRQPAGQTRRIRVDFPKVVEAPTPPSGSKAFWPIIVIGLLIALVLAVPGILLAVRHQRRIREAMRSTPPKQLTVATAIALISENEQFRGGAHPALILDLAQRGYLTLSTEKGGFFGGRKLRVESGEVDPGELPAAEQALVRQIAGQTLGHKERRALREWRSEHGESIRERLVTEGLLVRDKARRRRHVKIALLALLLAAATGLVVPLAGAADSAVLIALAVAVPAALVGIAFLVQACYPYRLTDAGRETKLALKGWLKQFQAFMDPKQSGMAETVEQTLTYLAWVPLADPDGARLTRLEKALRKQAKHGGASLRDLTPPRGLRLSVSQQDRERYGEVVAVTLALLSALRETQSTAAMVTATAGASAGGVSAGGGGGGAAGGGGGGAA